MTDLIYNVNLLLERRGFGYRPVEVKIKVMIDVLETE